MSHSRLFFLALALQIVCLCRVTEAQGTSPCRGSEVVGGFSAVTWDQGWPAFHRLAWVAGRKVDDVTCVPPARALLSFARFQRSQRWPPVTRDRGDLRLHVPRVSEVQHARRVCGSFFLGVADSPRAEFLSRARREARRAAPSFGRVVRTRGSTVRPGCNPPSFGGTSGTSPGLC